MSGLAARTVLSGLEELRRGSLVVLLPDGEVRRFGDSGAGAGLEVRLRILDERFFRRVLLGGETGAGASYIRGEWEADDLVGLVRLAIVNRDELRGAFPLAWVGGIRDLLLHRARRNTKRRAPGNIEAHYDLSNEFFALFLDPTMTYSCAVFDGPGRSLEHAQRHKYRLLARKADLGPGDEVLEIGCGWGGFARYAAREHGCRVTGITLSEAQARLARRRIEAEGLSDRIRIELRDYRDLEGTWDRIVSIEMLEAVGHDYLGTFFRVCDRALRPGGRAAVQVITMPEQRYATYRWRPDYIQRFVFPGAHLPSLEALAGAMGRDSGLVIEGAENIGPHYAETLRRWRERFLARRDEARALGFTDAFLRRWEFYLAYCEAGFAERYLGDHQLVLTRTGDRSLPAEPYRDGGARARAGGARRNGGGPESVRGSRGAGSRGDGVPTPAGGSDG